MKFLIVKLLNFCGIWCGVRPSSITVRGPEGAKYRVIDATINEHGDIVAHVVPSHSESAMSLDEVKTGTFELLVGSRPGNLELVPSCS